MKNFYPCFKNLLTKSSQESLTKVFNLCEILKILPHQILNLFFSKTLNSREEETVMDLLRKRVGELQLDRNFSKKTKEEEEREEEEKPLLKAVLEQTTDKDFIIDCLCWHNEYRARHNVPAMSIAMKLCVSAQEWANHLASRNELYYCPSRIFNFGQNIFCCVETCVRIV